MGKCDFDNRMSLRGAYVYATWQSQQNKIIGRDPHVSPLDFLRMTILKIGSSLEFFSLQKIGVTLHVVILGQQRVTRVSRIIKWILGSSPRMTGERKCPMMTILMGILISSMSMTGTVKAECTPTPDCATMGYTETSCDGKFVRCPFDVSKLLCIPCDSTYKHICTGTGYSGGEGASCNGKYASCVCSSGYKWNGSACMVPDCNVGDIYYSDKSCSSSYDSSKTAIGVVIKKNELVMSKDRVGLTWSSVQTDTSLTNVTSSQAQADMNGKSNTAVIVAEYPSETTSNNAAIYCNSYTTAGTSAGDWYLPAAGELYSYVYGNYCLNCPLPSVFLNSFGWSTFNWYFWSSSESDKHGAWYVGARDGGIGWDGKLIDHSVTCFLEIS